MSIFSGVDDDADPQRAVMYLEFTAQAQTGMKHYAAAAHARRRPQGPVMDLGCGSGHDLILLAAAGVAAIGVDPSAVLLSAAATRANTTPLVRALGESLPFRDETLAGCRVERVLIHVEDPVTVLCEAVRCLRPGALLTVCEPDWNRYRVRDDPYSDSAAWIAPVTQSGVGGALWSLIEDTGCLVLDRVEELSVWRSLATLNVVIDLPAAIARAVAARRIRDEEAQQWVERQEARERRGEFYSTIPKVLIVAQKP
jgi:SAM-dependent methyltransferase